MWRALFLISPYDSDDEEEGEEGGEGASKEQPVKDGDAMVEAEGDVKPEPETKPQARRQTRQGTPSTELHVYTIPELMKFKKDELVAETVYLEGKYPENQLLFAISYSWFIEQIKNARPDLTVLKEYKQREQEFFNRAKDLELITAERDTQKAKYDGLRKQRLDEFMSGFNLISLKLKEMYQVCLNGIWCRALVDDWRYLDDHSRWQRRTWVSRQSGSVLRRNHLQRYASQEELEEHLQFVWWGKGQLDLYLWIWGLNWYYFIQTLSSLALVFALHVFKVYFIFSSVLNQILNLYFDILLANASLLYGRDRCCAWLPKRFYCSELY